MADRFPYIKVPEHLKEVVGECDEGTHIYRTYGTQEQFRAWFDAVCDICGVEGSVSPGGVAGYVRVSRAAVHKRLKMGRLSAFLFHVVEDSWFSKSRKKLSEGGTPYTFIPVTECRAWIEELEDVRRFDKDLAHALSTGDGDEDGKILKPPRNWKEKSMKGGEKT